MSIYAAIALTTLGLAVHWALRINIGNIRYAANNPIVVCLTMVGWLLICMGITALVSPIGLLLALVLFGMTVARFRNNERRALLWTLSLAAERGLPLATSARAFAARRSDEMARRALKLADHLDAGMSLDAALDQSGNPLPADAELMVHLGIYSHATGQALRESRTFAEETDQAWMPVFGQVAYLMQIGLMGVFITTFIMVKIIPTYREIFYDFGVELPLVTQLMISLSNVAANYAWLLAPICLYFIICTLIFAFFYARGRFWMPPPFNWILGKTDKPILLRALAVCVDQELPMLEAFRRLARDYPDAKVRRQLTLCSGATEVGTEWCETLQRESVVTPEEAAVLKAATQSNSLSWALRELAEICSQKMVYRAKLIANVLSAVGILLLAAPVALLAFGCFVPLVDLIQGVADATY